MVNKERKTLRGTDRGSAAATVPTPLRAATGFETYSKTARRGIAVFSPSLRFSVPAAPLRLRLSPLLRSSVCTAVQKGSASFFPSVTVLRKPNRRLRLRRLSFPTARRSRCARRLSASGRTDCSDCAFVLLRFSQGERATGPLAAERRFGLRLVACSLSRRQAHGSGLRDSHADCLRRLLAVSPLLRLSAAVSGFARHTLPCAVGVPLSALPAADLRRACRFAVAFLCTHPE